MSDTVLVALISSTGRTMLTAITALRLKNGAPPLMDGGFVAAPSSGIYNPLTGEWEVENIDVAPDIEVVQDPALVRTGHDPQLEKAVEVVIEELKKNPPPKLSRPAFPNHYPTAAK